MEKINGILGKVLKETEKRKEKESNVNETSVEKIIKQTEEKDRLLEVAVALSEKMIPDRIINRMSEILARENIIENDIEVSDLKGGNMIVGINIMGQSKVELENKWDIYSEDFLKVLKQECPNKNILIKINGYSGKKIEFDI